MAKLILAMGGLTLKEIPLVKERLTIGRKPHNDIQIDNRAISGEHASLVTILNDSFLEDLNSTNGTLVNGQPIKKHFLQHGDVITLSKYQLKYLNAPPADCGPLDAEERAVPVAGMRLLNGPNAGKTLQLTKAQTSLGKSGVQVALITRHAQGYFITHVEGKQFPLVNAQAINAQGHLLADHDVIELAGIKMEFFLGG